MLERGVTYLLLFKASSHFYYFSEIATLEYGCRNVKVLLTLSILQERYRVGLYMKPLLLAEAK